MQRKGAVLCCVVFMACVLCLPLVVKAQERGKPKFEWSVQEYPDPFSYDTFSLCGRKNQSNICDPNMLIPVNKANKIDSLIWKVYWDTRCNCSKCIQNRHGYLIRVAVMPRMKSIFKNGDGGMMAKLRDAQMFSYILTKNWAMDTSCNESILILFSRYDGVLYTLTLPLAGSVLKEDHIKRISMSVRHLFDDDDTIGDGLYQMIDRYWSILANKPNEAFNPPMFKTGADRSTAVFVFPSVISSFLLSALLLIIIH